jgi:NAD(P)-dependent dehydrogenase (short-subunit alcohol dehydrogenase family)
MSLLARIKGVGPSGFGFGSTADDVTEGLDLRGRTMLVTGCNSGIGLETVRTLAKRGVHVFATARTEQKARDAIAALGTEVFPLACELSDPVSIRACIDTVKRQVRRLDAIICNAGIMALPKLEQALGYELQFFTNHMGHFLLVTGLLDSLADDGRVVVVSSEAQKAAPKVGIEFDNLSGERNYSPWKAYGQSKLANLLFSKQLAKRLASTKKTANAVHPGVIRTNLGRTMPSIARFALSLGEPLFLKSPAQGAATQCYVATNPKLGGVSGAYFADCNIAESTSLSRDPALAARLWDESERIATALR